MLRVSSSIATIPLFVHSLRLCNITIQRKVSQFVVFLGISMFFYKKKTQQPTSGKNLFAHRTLKNIFKGQLLRALQNFQISLKFQYHPSMFRLCFKFNEIFFRVLTLRFVKEAMSMSLDVNNWDCVYYLLQDCVFFSVFFLSFFCFLFFFGRLGWRYSLGEVRQLVDE